MVEAIDNEIISTIIIFPSADLRRVGVSYKLKYVHKVLVKAELDLKEFLYVTAISV